jgi:hypothetical protein
VWRSYRHIHESNLLASAAHISGRLNAAIWWRIDSKNLSDFPRKKKICERLVLFCQCDWLLTDFIVEERRKKNENFHIFLVSLSSRLSIISQTCLEGRVRGFIYSWRETGLPAIIYRLSSRLHWSTRSSDSPYRTRIGNIIKLSPLCAIRRGVVSKYSTDM